MNHSVSLVKKLFALLLAVSAFHIAPAFAANTAPVISGTPSTVAYVNTTYSFQPKASDANGDPLTFVIYNKPSWATFSRSTGLLTGKPTTTGEYRAVIIGVSDGKTTSYVPTFIITVKASGTSTNYAPTLSGAPSTSATVGTAYSFTPTAKDANGDALGFSISNKPAWATFSTSTGKLSGTPWTANIGTYSNIVIKVSDGKTTTSLPAFAITVKAASTSGGSSTTSGAATLNWTPPTTNSDGSVLTNLAGYKIYYGTSATNLASSITVSNAGLTSYVVSSLSSGTWYFAIKSVNSLGVESALSNTVSKTI